MQLLNKQTNKCEKQKRQHRNKDTISINRRRTKVEEKFRTRKSYIINLITNCYCLVSLSCFQEKKKVGKKSHHLLVHTITKQFQMHIFYACLSRVMFRLGYSETHSFIMSNKQEIYICNFWGVWGKCLSITYAFLQNG